MENALMQNPWLELPPLPPYVLPGDGASIASLNRRFSDKGRVEHAINGNSIPEPFIGNPCSATVVLLNLNPGDSEVDRKSHADPGFRAAMLRNLRHQPQEYPFYPLNPDFAWTACAKWWTSHLRELLQHTSRMSVAQHLCVIEWFPYHSPKADLPNRMICPSQQYSFSLAKRLLGEKRIVIGMRAKNRWTQVDSRFGDIPYLRSCQNPAISRRNTGEGLFSEVLERLS